MRAPAYIIPTYFTCGTGDRDITTPPPPPQPQTKLVKSRCRLRRHPFFFLCLNKRQRCTASHHHIIIIHHIPTGLTTHAGRTWELYFTLRAPRDGNRRGTDGEYRDRRKERRTQHGCDEMRWDLHGGRWGAALQDGVFCFSEEGWEGLGYVNTRA
jgi:hypothetical protein